MLKNIFTIIVGLLALSLLYAFVVPNLHKTNPGPIGCTMEAKICPDGSAVGRAGPNCEFALCPPAPVLPTETGTIIGEALLGPTCPVERVPPDPACADRPYEGDFAVLNDRGYSQNVRTDASGTFSVTVPVGTYRVASISARVLPFCAPVGDVLVLEGQVSRVSISCDSGIR